MKTRVWMITGSSPTASGWIEMITQEDWKKIVHNIKSLDDRGCVHEDDIIANLLHNTKIGHAIVEDIQSGR
jgi:hypothetical protein